MLQKEQLLELLEELCNLPDVQKMIKVMVAPSKSDIDRLIQSFLADVKSICVILVMKRITTGCVWH